MDECAKLAYEHSVRRLDDQALPGSEMYERLYEFRSNIGEVHRQLAYQLDRTWVANAREIRWLLWWFRAAAGALVAEILFLLIAAGGILG